MEGSISRGRGLFGSGFQASSLGVMDLIKGEPLEGEERGGCIGTREHEYSSHACRMRYHFLVSGRTNKMTSVFFCSAIIRTLLTRSRMPLEA